MTVKRERNPAPEMSFKRSKLVVSIAIFYKRPITVDDVAEINPSWGAHRDKVKKVFKRLVSHGYLEQVGDAYAITDHGAHQLHEYGRWHARQPARR